MIAAPIDEHKRNIVIVRARRYYSCIFVIIRAFSNESCGGAIACVSGGVRCVSAEVVRSIS